MTIQLLVLNCNVTEATTMAIDAVAQSVVGPRTEVITIAPEWGVESAEGYLDSFIAATAMMERLASWPGRPDAVVLAGFGEHGREAARELLEVPVVDITDAAAHVALMVAPCYGVVTTLSRSVMQIRDSLRNAGVGERCVGVSAVDVPVLDLDAENEAIRDQVVERAQGLIDRGAEAIILGCAAFAGRATLFETILGVPVIDPVGAGVVCAEALVRVGLRTSKVSTYAEPRPKSRPGWGTRGAADSVRVGLATGGSR